MPIDIVPHSEALAPAVEAFNQRMIAGGSNWGFYTDPIPDWIAPEEGACAWREYHLALEDGSEVRGGYALKPQQWQIGDETHWVTDWQGPFTEAEINAKYSPLMLRLARSAQKQYDKLFSLGHSEKDANLLQKLGWGIMPLPFCFVVNKPFRFLREANYLRSSSARRIIMDILAFTGAGWLGMQVLRAALRLRHRGTAKASGTATAHEVDTFGTWADELWEANHSAYRCLAVRDRRMMNRLLPTEGWPGGIRLRIDDAQGNPIGWSVVFDKSMENDDRFGDLRVALVGDCFAYPDNAANVLAATDVYLRERGVDLVCANMSHPAWNGAFAHLGYTVLPNRRLFAFSPALRELLEQTCDISEGLHLTNLDGHGPHGYTD